MIHKLSKASCLFLTIIMAFVGCSSYDDSEIKNQIEDLDSRVTKLEALVSQMNTNISSYLKTVEALEDGDRIISVAALEDGSGYTITFSKTGSIIIYNGQDGENGEDGAPGSNGEDGHSPKIGVKQDTDGTYYWTVDDEFLLDNSGNKIAATAHIATPKVQISTDGKHYEISFDNGISWLTVGDVMDTASASTIFSKVEDGTDAVTFTLTDGSTIVIPKVQLFGLNISNTQIGIAAGQTIEISYTVTAADEETVVDGIGNNGYAVYVEATSTSSGVVKITAPTPLVNGKAIIMAVNAKGTTSGKILTFEEGVLTLVADATSVEATASSVTVKVTTNLNYKVVIPDDAKPWITLIETKAPRTETLTFSIAENTGAARSAIISLVDGNMTTLQSFEIKQSAGSGQPQDPDSGYSIYDWEYDESISF